MIDTAALRALLAQTTQGIWKSGEFSVSAGDTDIFEYPSGSFSAFTENAAFIATAHNTIPALLDEIDTLRADLRRYQVHVAANDHYYQGGDINEDSVYCQGCDATYLVGDCGTAQHAPGCIVAEALAAQHERGAS